MIISLDKILCLERYKQLLAVSPFLACSSLFHKQVEETHRVLVPTCFVGYSRRLFSSIGTTSGFAFSENFICCSIIAQSPYGNSALPFFFLPCVEEHYLQLSVPWSLASDAITIPLIISVSLYKYFGIIVSLLLDNALVVSTISVFKYNSQCNFPACKCHQHDMRLPVIRVLGFSHWIPFSFNAAYG